MHSTVIAQLVNKPDVAVVLETDDSARCATARQLARELQAPLIRFETNSSQPPNIANEFLLAVRCEGLELRDARMRPGRGICVDFSGISPRLAGRRGGLSRRQPLARAIGKETKTVLDATAGLGHDSALLACMGFKVTAVERSPIVAALLRDGAQRAFLEGGSEFAYLSRLSIARADARFLLRRGEIDCDVIYIDPMFPPKRKQSALAKKSIRLLRQLVGDDGDAAELLEVARDHCHRVVVKRPTHAPPLAPKPTVSFPGKLVRYDVYVDGA